MQERWGTAIKIVLAIQTPVTNYSPAIYKRQEGFQFVLSDFMQRTE